MKAITCEDCGTIGYSYDYVEARRPGGATAKLKAHKQSRTHQHRVEFRGLDTYVRHVLWQAGVLTRAQAKELLDQPRPELRGMGTTSWAKLRAWLT